MRLFSMAFEDHLGCSEDAINSVDDLRKQGIIPVSTSRDGDGVLIKYISSRDIEDSKKLIAEYLRKRFKGISYKLSTKDYADNGFVFAEIHPKQ